MNDSEQLRGAKKPGWVVWIVNHFPPGQFGRYLLVGLINTVFGYFSFASLNKALTSRIPYSYVFVGPIANVINVTFSLLNYKWFIFKTKGNYIREWLRCATVSVGGIILGTVSLPALVFVIRRSTPLAESAPYVAWAILLAVSAIVSFIGHRHFTFARPARVPVNDSVTKD